MFKNVKFRVLAWMILSLSGAALQGSEVSDWVIKIGSTSEADRTVAIAAIRESGAKIEKELLKIEAEQKMEPQQLFVFRKLIGELTLKRSSLKPIDPTSLNPFGSDKEKGVAGNLNLQINKDKKIISMNAEFCTENGPLEFLLVSAGSEKQHETIAMTKAIPSDICTAMLVCAYTYAGELGEDGKVNLPKDAGVMVSIEFDYEVPHANMQPSSERPVSLDKESQAKIEKKTVRVPIECFAWNTQTEQMMKRAPFAFTGSSFEKDPVSGKMVFVADALKSVIAAKLDPYAIMNTPLDMKEVNPYQGEGYSISRFTIPSRKTHCRVVFEPWEGGVLTEADLKDTGVKK